MFEFCLIRVRGVALMTFKGSVLGTCISQGFQEKQNQKNGQGCVCMSVGICIFMNGWISRDLFQGI